MDTQLLRAFITVAQGQSFSSAGDSLGLTQSAVSKRIAQLENHLAQPLFDRIGRSIHLTEAGHLLLPRAKAILDAVTDAERVMEQQHESISGPLKLATSHHIGIHRLPPYLETFSKKYPDVRLQLQFIDSEQALSAIDRAEFDLAIITLPDNSLIKGQHDHDNIQQHQLWSDPMRIVTHIDHPLQNKKRVSLEDLSRFPAILPDTSTQTSLLVDALFKQQNLSLHLSMTTNHLDAIKMMVGIGLGWSALPERLIDDTTPPLSVQGVKLVRQLGCIHHRQRTLTNAARAMLHCLQASH